MNGYDRTWPTALVAIGIGTAMGWAAFGPNMSSNQAEIVFFEEGSRPASVEAEQVAQPTVPTAPEAPAEARARADRMRQISVLGSLDPDGLMDLLRSSANPADRRNAAVLLGGHPYPEVVLAPLMIALRMDVSPEVRFKSAESLARLGSRDAMGSLHLAATRDDDLRVREAAVAALATVGQAEAIPLLTEILRTDRSEYVRAEAVRGLMKIGDKESIEAVTSVMRTERSPIVGRALQEALTSSREDR